MYKLACWREYTITQYHLGDMVYMYGCSFLWNKEKAWFALFFFDSFGYAALLRVTRSLATSPRKSFSFSQPRYIDCDNCFFLLLFSFGYFLFKNWAKIIYLALPETTSCLPPMLFRWYLGVDNRQSKYSIWKETYVWMFLTFSSKLKDIILDTLNFHNDCGPKPRFKRVWHSKKHVISQRFLASK